MSDIVEVEARSSSDQAPVGFCPHCGARLDAQAFVQEYWMAHARRFHVWCHGCAHAFDIEATERVLTHEPAH